MSYIIELNRKDMFSRNHNIDYRLVISKILEKKGFKRQSINTFISENPQSPLSGLEALLEISSSIPDLQDNMLVAQLSMVA